MSIKSFLVDGLGLRGARNMASWAVAGGLAYYLWIRPDREAAEERRVGLCNKYSCCCCCFAVEHALGDGLHRLDPCADTCCSLTSLVIADLLQISRELAKQRAIEQGLLELERVKPLPDPQDTGLIVGNKKK